MITRLAAEASDTISSAGIDGGTATLIGAGIGLIATIAAAVVAVKAAVRGYRVQQHESRRQELATFFADAVRAVEDYAEMPYRIRRRDGSAETRTQITNRISDVKSSISFYCGWMEINASDAVRSAYLKFVAAAQREAGQQMTAAWNGAPTKKDRQVPIGSALTRVETDASRKLLLDAMRIALSETAPRT